MKKLFMPFLLVMFVIDVYSQDIFLKVYNGKVSLPDGQVIDRDFRYVMPVKGKLTFSEDARAVVFTKNKLFRIEGGADPRNMNYSDVSKGLSYEDCRAKLIKNAAAGKSSLLSYLLDLHEFSNLEESSQGAVVGGVRGIEDAGKKQKVNGETIFPEDSTKILSNTVRLRWPAGRSVFGSRLIVVNTSTNDTVYNQSALHLSEASIPVAKEGIYKWCIYSKMENKRSLQSMFIRPAEDERKAISSRLENFKKEIAPLDEELRELVLADYLFQNRIIAD